MIHRPNRELRGKELSANTLASFLYAQGANSAQDLSPNVEMRLDVLLFLNNLKMIRYWKDNGWLIQTEDAALLTEAGIEKAVKRVTGQDGSYSVEEIQVNEALQIIRGAITPEDEELEHFQD